MLSHNAEAWGATSTKYRWGIMADTGSISTVNALGTAANDKTVIALGCEQAPASPAMLAARMAADFCGSDPARNFDYTVLNCPPPSSSYAFTDAEIESGLASGVSPLKPTYDGQRLQIVRLVTTKTTESGATFEPLRDLVYSRVAAWRAFQFWTAVTTSVFRPGQSFSVNDEVIALLRDILLSIDRAGEALGYMAYVEDLASPDQTVIEQDATVPSRLNVSSPFIVPPPLHQVAAVHHHIFGKTF